MKREQRYVFGPVPSRRFGRSLGVDLTPYKTCSLDCVFCQLGRTTVKTVSREEYVPTDRVLAELLAWLKGGGTADYITLSGSGEPTLHSRFGEVLAFIREKSGIPSVLLTNGTMLHLREVREAAAQASVVKISLSAWDEASFDWVNRPHPQLQFDQLVEGERTFRRQFRGELWMEVFLVGGMNSTPRDVSKIASLAKEIQPDRIHLNTSVRPPAEDFVTPLSREQMVELAGLFEPTGEIIGEFGAKHGEPVKVKEDEILSMIERRPCTAEQIADVFGMHMNEVSKYLGKLVRTDRVRADHKRNTVYYEAVRAEARDNVPV
jgi:wyosine [tRNA(Phe)-imidazoG37] synthetase (radical SAM superfamily)